MAEPGGLRDRIDMADIGLDRAVCRRCLDHSCTPLNAWVAVECGGLDRAQPSGKAPGVNTRTACLDGGDVQRPHDPAVAARHAPLGEAPRSGRAWSRCRTARPDTRDRRADARSRQARAVALRL